MTKVSPSWHHRVLETASAWRFTRGENTTIAIIDLGFDIKHPSISNGVVRAFTASKGGVSAANLDSMPIDDHGTHCMGAAGGRKQRDGVGIAPAAGLIAGSVSSVTDQTILANAIHEAIFPAQGGAAADIVSCSLGRQYRGEVLREEMQKVLKKARNKGRSGRGAIIFWATSNRNTEIKMDEPVSSPLTIAVGAHGRDGRPMSGASGEGLDFLAPGESIPMPGIFGSWEKRSGTSYACALAAGVGALALSVDPSLEAGQVRRILHESCEPIEGVKLERVGSGRLRASKAVTLARSFTK